MKCFRASGVTTFLAVVMSLAPVGWLAAADAPIASTTAATIANSSNANPLDTNRSDTNASAAGGVASRPATVDAQGELQLVAWDMIVSPDAMDEIRAAGKRVDSPNNLYVAYRCDARALHDALIDAKSEGAVLRLRDEVMLGERGADGQFKMNPLLPEFEWADGSTVALRTVIGSLSFAARIDGDSVHLSLDNREALRLKEADKGPNKKYPTVVEFDGDLAEGQAAMLAAQLQGASGMTYDHLRFWEVFKLDPVEARFVGDRIDPDAWLGQGGGGLRRAVDRRIAWEVMVRSHPLPELSIDKQFDGFGISIDCVMDEEDGSGIVWDARGNPDLNRWPPQSHPIGAKLFAQVQSSMRIAKSPPDAPQDIFKPGAAVGTGMAAAVDAQGRVTVAAATQPWEKVGEINFDQPLNAPGGPFTLTRPQMLPDASRTAALLDFPASRDKEYGLVAVRRNGSIVKSRDMAGSPLTDVVQRSTWATFEKLPEDQVKTFVVWSRKLKWISVGGFALKPTTQPAQPTPAELRADEKKLLATGILRQ